MKEKLKTWWKKNREEIAIYGGAAIGVGVLVMLIAKAITKDKGSDDSWMDEIVVDLVTVNPNSKKTTASIREALALLAVHDATLDELCEDDRIPTDVIASVWYDKVTDLPKVYKDALYALWDRNTEEDLA